MNTINRLKKIKESYKEYDYDDAFEYNDVEHNDEENEVDTFNDNYRSALFSSIRSLKTTVIELLKLPKEKQAQIRNLVNAKLSYYDAIYLEYIDNILWGEAVDVEYLIDAVLNNEHSTGTEAHNIIEAIDKANITLKDIMRN